MGRPKSKNTMMNKKKPFKKNFLTGNKKEEAPRERGVGSRTPQLLRGMKDVLPADQDTWFYLYDKAREIARDYSFLWIETPIIESAGLFKRGIGAATDIVEKEMYAFTDLNGEAVALRPENTASIVRAYIEHGMINQPQPVKMWYFGPMFRHERPQSGRLRQFHQFGLEVIGEENAAVDAQIILATYNFYKEIGLEVNVQINSIGCQECRGEYKKNLQNYYRSKKKLICEDCQDRLNKNPLRLLDCKNPKCQEVKAAAPQIIDWLCEDCKNHFMGVIEYLDEIDIPYVLNPHLVRGLDYYTRTVFEVWTNNEEQSRQSALGGGGRYDLLSEQLGGRPTPACGVSIGIERVISELRKQEIAIPLPPKPLVFLAQVGKQAKQKCFSVFEDLRRGGIKAAESITKDSLKSQLEVADKLDVEYVLILGQKELLEGTILLRDMEAGVQETLDLNKLIPELKKKLGNG